MAHASKYREAGAEAPPEAPLRAAGAPPRALVGLEDFWLISDTHFGHRNIARYAGRPEDHERRIIAAWRERVGEGEPILHLGDLALMKREWLERLMDGLPGRIMMVQGNHDRGGMAMYRELGIELVKRSFMLPLAGWGVWFSHRPEPARLAGNRQLNLHGHIHEKTMDDPRCRNVCVEHTDYAPVRVAALLGQAIAAQPARGRRR